MSTLYASAVRKNITPSDATRAEWNKSAPKKFLGPIAECWVQVLVFSDKDGQMLIHVGGDIISPFPAPFRETIEKEFGVKPSCVFLSSTHNHMLPDLGPGPGGVSPSGSPGGPGGAARAGGRPPGAGAPATGGGPPAGMFGAISGVREWVSSVNGMTLDALREAIQTLRPARIGAGKGVSGLSVNREWDTPVGSLGTGDRNGDTLHQVNVLRVDEVGGKPIAVLVNSNCHAGSFFGGNVGLDHRLVGGDVAGWVSEFVGNAIGRGVVPIWAIGGAGDQNTYFHSGMMIPQVDANGSFVYEEYVMKDEDAIALARNAAAMQAQEALAVYNNITEYSTNFDLKSGIVYKTGKRKRASRVAPGRPGGNALPGKGPTPPAVEIEPTVYDDQTFRFYLITLNGIAFAGANSESFVNLKKAALGVLPYDNVFWIDMNFDTKSGSAGYVPAARFDDFYNQGRRHNLQGVLMEFNGSDMLKLYADGMDELVKTIQ